MRGSLIYRRRGAGKRCHNPNGLEIYLNVYVYITVACKMPKYVLTIYTCFSFFYSNLYLFHKGKKDPHLNILTIDLDKRSR